MICLFCRGPIHPYQEVVFDHADHPWAHAECLRKECE